MTVGDQRWTALRRERARLLLALADDPEAAALEMEASHPGGAGREAWIARLGAWVERRQAAVSRLAEIDAGLGREGDGGAPADEPARAGRERVRRADARILARLGRQLDEVRRELVELHRSRDAIRRYLTHPSGHDPLLRGSL